MEGKCDVCGQQTEVVVACSVMGPVSLAYCQVCLQQKREPYGVVVAGLVGCFPESLDDIRPALYPYIHATLKAEGKTVEQLLADIRAAEEEYMTATSGERRGCRMKGYVADVDDKGHIPIARWGQDHWSTFCYLETRVVDDKGKIDNCRMRCNPRLHRHFAHAADATLYPTRCKGVTIESHDDWSCVEDMVAEELLEASSDTKPGQPFGEGRATVKLTDRGWAIAGQLRRHRAEGKPFQDFVPKEESGL